MKKIPFAVGLCAVAMALFGSVPEVGMSENDLLKIKGKPESKMVGPSKSVYRWPDLSVEIVDGRIAKIIEREIAQPVGDTEITLIGIFASFQDKTRGSMSREEYEALLKEVMASYRAQQSGIKSKPFLEESRRYLGAHISVSIIWRSVQVGFRGRVTMLVEKRKEPDAFRLISEMPPEKMRKVRLFGSNSYELEDISPVMTHVDEVYWPRLRAVFEKALENNTDVPSAETRGDKQDGVGGGVSQPGEVRVQVFAGKPWNKTGINISKGEYCVISYTAGKWRPNRHWGPVDGNGSSTYAATSGYPLPGRAEGSLIGKVGEGRPFFVGNVGRSPSLADGELFLGVNDDPHGFGDNEGSIWVEVKKYVPNRPKQEAPAAAPTISSGGQ